MSELKNKKRRFYLNKEVVAEIRHDSLFATRNILTGFIWDDFEDIDSGEI